MSTLIGPFAQILPLDDLPWKGALSDEQLTIHEQAGVVVFGGKVQEIGPFHQLAKKAEAEGWTTAYQEKDLVLLPGFVDCHTHICFAGDRAGDYALRNQGVSYLEIAQQGGGIWSTVAQTRHADLNQLAESVHKRADQLFRQGITTIEVKSGYGLDVGNELKMLEAIQKANASVLPDLIPTCLAAHMRPRDYEGSGADYLRMLLEKLLPRIREKDLARRVDIFVEETAFSPAEALSYLQAAQAMGFQGTVHADQFSTGGSQVAIRAGALSADHLEASGDKELEALAQSKVAAVALPGASLGLGMKFAPARKLLDRGGCLAIASDWNPGSAPMGHLLTQASLLGAYEKLSNAEILSGITFRAAHALGLNDRGRLQSGLRADMVAFPEKDYRAITYRQGQLVPARIWLKGIELLKGEYGSTDLDDLEY